MKAKDILNIIPKQDLIPLQIWLHYMIELKTQVLIKTGLPSTMSPECFQTYSTRFHKKFRYEEVSELKEILKVCLTL